MPINYISRSEHNRNARGFEEYARDYLNKLWKVSLKERKICIAEKFKKKLDLVTEDHKFIGDAKYYAKLKDPGAQWSAIAEYVWFLEKIDAPNKFLVFGKDKEVAKGWLKKHSSLVQKIKFYFLSEDKLEELN